MRSGLPDNAGDRVKNAATFGKEAETFGTLPVSETNRRIQGNCPFFSRIAVPAMESAGSRQAVCVQCSFLADAAKLSPVFSLLFCPDCHFLDGTYSWHKKSLFSAADCLSPVCPGYCHAIKFMPECRSKDKTELLHPNGQKWLFSRKRRCTRFSGIEKSDACPRRAMEWKNGNKDGQKNVME